MANKTALPSRFQAQGTPGEGLVEIVDVETGKSGKIPLSALPTISGLFENLFGSTVSEELSTEVESDPKPSPTITEDAEEVKVSPEPEISEEPVKRKRGRPKKVVTDEAAEEAPKRKPGRPRKVVSEEETTETPKRKPGRPKKVVADDTGAEQPPKRKPGRPKKVVEDKNPEETAPKDLFEQSEPPEPKVEEKAAAKQKPAPAEASDNLDGVEFADEIPNEGFKIVRDKELDGVIYDIILDDGKAIGIIEMNDDGKTCTVRPGPQSDEEQTTHVSLNGALARIYVDWVIDL